MLLFAVRVEAGMKEQEGLSDHLAAIIKENKDSAKQFKYSLWRSALEI